MSGIPYNELQPIEITAKDDGGKTVVLETLYFSLVIPCRDCRWWWGTDNLCMLPDGNGDYMRMYTEPDGFCAWGERGNDG